MNILVKTMGGGIFSIFTVAIQQILHNVSNVKDIENIYIEIDKSRQVYSNNEIIEWVQKIENETVIVLWMKSNYGVIMDDFLF